MSDSPVIVNVRQEYLELYARHPLLRFVMLEVSGIKAGRIDEYNMTDYLCKVWVNYTEDFYSINAEQVFHTVMQSWMPDVIP